MCPIMFYVPNVLDSLPGLQSNVLVGAAPYALPTHIPTLPEVFKIMFKSKIMIYHFVN